MYTLKVVSLHPPPHHLHHPHPHHHHHPWLWRSMVSPQPLPIEQYPPHHHHHHHHHHGHASCMLAPRASVSASCVAVLLLSLGTTFLHVEAAPLPQEQPEPSRGNCATCLGVVDDTLGSCGTLPNCVSTFDDRPQFFIPPWEFPGQLSTAIEDLTKVLINEGADIKEEGDRYIYAVFKDKDGFVDDVEFLFSDPSEDATVNIHSASRAQNSSDNGRNHKRLEGIRSVLRWEEVPILRNRKRLFFFLESPWDTFGPEPPPIFDSRDELEIYPD